MTVRIDYVCPHCGSNDLWFNASASWNAITQEWEYGDADDDPWCVDCEKNVRYVRIVLP